LAISYFFNCIDDNLVVMNATNSIDLVSGRVVELDNDQLQQALLDVNQMADAARKVIVPYFRSFGELENKLDASPATTTFDPVTRADKEAEQAIVEIIRQRRPDDGIFGEEHGYHAHNGEKSILGVMDQPILEERFIGKPGGAQLYTRSGVRDLAVRSTTNLADAWTCVTTPDVFAGSKEAVLFRLNEQVASIRYGTDCYGYAMLAAGMVDLVIEPGLEAYDIQAMIPIIESAGGVVTDWQGRAVSNGGDVVAAARHSNFFACTV